MEAAYVWLRAVAELRLKRAPGSPSAWKMDETLALTRVGTSRLLVPVDEAAQSVALWKHVKVMANGDGRSNEEVTPRPRYSKSKGKER